jgi:hypothetical protein
MERYPGGFGSVAGFGNTHCPFFFFLDTKFEKSLLCLAFFVYRLDKVYLIPICIQMYNFLASKPARAATGAEARLYINT